jgi:hypothetical protein
MEQDQNATTEQKSTNPPRKYSPLNSPDSSMASSNDPSPITSGTRPLSLTIPEKSEKTVSSSQKQSKPEDEDQRYWDEEDEGYWGEIEGDEEDLEETYRSVL